MTAGEQLIVDGERYVVVLEGSGDVRGEAFRAGTVWELGPGKVKVEAETPVTLLLTGRP